MKPRLILRPQMPGDLEVILNYLAARSPAAADRFANAVATTLDGLASMPGKGSPKHFAHKELAGIRTWSMPGFRNYLILYRPIADGIVVLAITHGDRQLPGLLKKRL